MVGTFVCYIVKIIEIKQAPTLPGNSPGSFLDLAL